MGGPLPISDGNMLDYFRVNQVPRWQWTDLSEVVFWFDGIWLELKAKKADAEAAAAKAQKPKAAPRRK